VVRHLRRRTLSALDSDPRFVVDMNAADLPPPPPLTSNEIVGLIADHWVKNIGADPDEAAMRAERGFMHMLATDSIREWGFSPTGETLYEPHSPVAAETIVYVMIQKETH